MIALQSSAPLAHAPSTPPPAYGAHPASTPPPPIVWPPERAHDGSDAGQARTVSAATLRPKSKRYGVIAVVSALGVCASVGSGVIAWRVTSRAVAPVTTSAASETAVTREVTPPPVVTVPAPTIAPPGLEDPGKNEVAPPTPAPSQTAATTIADAGARAKPLSPIARPFAPARGPTPAPAPAPAPAPKMPDRPGPGF